jgi:two-component system response regulator FixJ
MAGDVTVFVVDDDPGVLDAAEEMIRGAGLRPKCFRASEEFLHSISASDAGCVVLDLRLPILDGFQVLERLRAKQCHLPAIVVTGYGDIPTAVRAMQLGAVTFLEKPFQPKVLLAEIQKAVALDRQSPESRLMNETNGSEFTDSERRLISGLMRGLTDAEMAGEIDVSRRTVQHWKKRLFDKVGVGCRRELLERLFDRARPI